MIEKDNRGFEPYRAKAPEIDHISQSKPGIRAMNERLYVIAVISNPARYKIRYELYRAFEKHVRDSGGILYTVELAFGDRDWEVTEADDPHDIQLRTTDELWHKENMINLGIQRLPLDWKYVAWIDADVTFIRPDWCQETIHQLQHYSIVQMFSHAQDVGPNYWQLTGNGTFQGFMYSYKHGATLPYKDAFTPSFYTPGPKGDMMKWHSGYAWAARREAIDALGGLIDFAVLGSADHNMAAALIGRVDLTIHKQVHPNLTKQMHLWQSRAERYIRRNVGYVDGLLVHHWHGKKQNRGYVDRWKILTENQFDPEVDIKHDWQGLHQLNDHGDERSMKMRDEIRAYFRFRNEDSIDVD